VASRNLPSLSPIDRLVIIENGYHPSTEGSVVALSFAARSHSNLKVVVLDHEKVLEQGLDFANSVLILDLDSMHKLDALNLALQIRKSKRKYIIMFMSANPIPVIVREGMLAALEEKAFWLKKPAHNGQNALKEIIRVAAGDVIDDFIFIETIISENSYLGLLSPHQHRVMRLMSVGQSNSEIAKSCKITSKAAERTISKASKLIGVPVSSSANNHRVLAANKYLFLLFNVDSWNCRKNLSNGKSSL
jgi:DNA-binding NarL/FixJ family response regulator